MYVSITDIIITKCIGFEFLSLIMAIRECQIYDKLLSMIHDTFSQMTTTYELYLVLYQEYLHSSVRPYVRPSCMDLLCPAPVDVDH